MRVGVRVGADEAGEVGSGLSGDERDEMGERGRSEGGEKGGERWVRVGGMGEVRRRDGVGEKRLA